MINVVTVPLPPELELIQKYRTDPWEFLKDCVWTKDQVDKLQPIKRYPANTEWAEYLRYITWQVWTEPLLAIVKHRRMVITWTICGLWLCDVLFNEGRLNALGSKKEKDSDELVERCFFIYNNLPKQVEVRGQMVPLLVPTAKYTYCKLEVEEIDSRIIGVAEGENQLRQHTCSRVACDEMGFWPQARGSFMGLKPTLDGGGQVVLVSTRYPGFFQQVVEDKIDEDQVA